MGLFLCRVGWVPTCRLARVQGRMRDSGRDVLRISVLAVRFVCPNAHEWVMSSEAIKQAGEGAESCPACGLIAVDAQIEQQGRVVERRGVVIDLGAGDADA